MINNYLCQTFFSISCINDHHIVMEAGKNIKHKYLNYDISNHIGTIYRGSLDACFDCFSSWYKHCYYPGIHTILTATLSPFKNETILNKISTTKINESEVKNIIFSVKGRITIYVDSFPKPLLDILNRTEFTPYIIGYKLDGDFDSIIRSIYDIYQVLDRYTKDFMINFKLYTHAPSYSITNLHRIGDDFNA